MRTWLFCVAALCLLGGEISLTILPGSDGKSEICCMPQEWEAMLYLDYARVFIDSNTFFAYINGTVHAAYSFPKKKVYFRIRNGFELTPLFPKPNPINMTLLYDFDKMQLFNIDDGDCQKSPLQYNMTHQCIPHHAKMVSNGIVGYGNMTRMFQTYQFRTDTESPVDITASVFTNDLKPIEPKTCQPHTVHYFGGIPNPDSGDLYGLEFTDMGPVKSMNIFDIPKPCL